ncbi:MAG: hypothetical protein AAGB04_07060, partial [Pseudomonadota bacterium]
MSKLLYGVAISAILLGSSAVWANDNGGNSGEEPKDVVEVNNGTVNGTADDGDITVDIDGKNQVVHKHIPFFNVLDITQDGNNNKAGVVQLDDGSFDAYYSPYHRRWKFYYSYNGSWTYQKGNDNVDWGAQIARDYGVNFRLTKQEGHRNEAITFQDAGAHEYRRDVNFVSIEQTGNDNLAAGLQKGHGVNVLGITQNGNEHVAKSIQVNSNSFAKIDQSGHGNGAYTVQASIAPNRNIVVNGPTVRITGNSTPVHESKT